MPQNDKIFTISNALSMSRIVLAVPIIYCLQRGTSDPSYNIAALGLIVIGGLTDLFDGLLARKLNQITDLGKMLDPLADKIVTAVIPTYLAFTRPEFPVLLLAAALVRDSLIFTAAMYIRNKYQYLFTSNQLGKWTFFILALTFTAFIVEDNFGIRSVVQLLEALSFFLLAVSFLVYTRRLFAFINNHQERPL